jgi:hypothetical protein|nr:MAG TPA: hypothetical protein [Caudoviricetes sp.]
MSKIEIDKDKFTSKLGEIIVACPTIEYLVCLGKISALLLNISENDFYVMFDKEIKDWQEHLRSNKTTLRIMNDRGQIKATINIDKTNITVDNAYIDNVNSDSDGTTLYNIIIPVDFESLSEVSNDNIFEELKNRLND